MKKNKNAEKYIIDYLKANKKAIIKMNNQIFLKAKEERKNRPKPISS